jgi:hypothetical protein
VDFSPYPNFFAIPKSRQLAVGRRRRPPSRVPRPPPRLSTFQDAKHLLAASRAISRMRETGDDTGVVGELGGRSREIGRILTKSLKLRNWTNRVAHFVWEKNRARTTYIVKSVPRKTFCTL